MSSSASYARQLLAAMLELFKTRPFDVLTPRGRAWTGWRLALAAVLLGWQQATSINQRFQAVHELLECMHPRARRGDSYTGFMDALVQHGPLLLGELVSQLRQRLQALPPEQRQVEGWEAFSLDGTRAAAPRTAANEEAFPPSSRDKSGPQLQMVAIRHLASGMLVDWRVDKATAGERGAVLAMLGALPPQALLVMDAGLVGYDFLRTILDSGRHVLVRAGSNVRLLRKLGYVRGREDVVWLWPTKAQRQQTPPLVLRLICLQGDRSPVYLLTDVLNRRTLPDALAGRLYRRRWGIELLFRALKQTMGLGQLRCGQPERALCEWQWSGASLAVLLWLGLQHLPQGQEPLKLSLAGLLETVRRAMRRALRVCPMATLREDLSDAQQDGYQRKAPKTRQERPCKKQQRPAGPPTVLLATPAHVQAARRLAQRLKPTPPSRPQPAPTKELAHAHS